VAPRIFAAYITAKPTAPNPQTATELFAWKLGLFITAPQPVGMPQPRTHTLNGSLSGLIFANEIEARTVYSEKVEHPIK